MKIHIKSRKGMYTVISYNDKIMQLETKNSQFIVPIKDFKSLAGGKWNWGVSKEEEENFLKTVAPERMVKLESETQDIIKKLDLLKRLSNLEDKVFQNEQPSIDSCDDYGHDDNCGYDDYNASIDQYKSEIEELKNKMFNIGSKVYEHKIDFSNYEDYNGRKFVIKANNDKTEFKFCWDPFGFTDNWHSNISRLCYIDNFYVINGGWIKMIEDNVILYGKSGDYGVYDDKIAIECAKKIFPGKEIHSYAGRQWDDNLDDLFLPLPF